jgi:uncharacterized protein with HEPN domain
MLPEDDRIRLQHMLDAARKAVRLAAGRDRHVLDDEDDPLADALVHLISVIGEAASKMSSGTCSELGGIPWPDVIGMRNRLIHAYFDINLDILWPQFRTACPPSSDHWSLLWQQTRECKRDIVEGQRTRRAERKPVPFIPAPPFGTGI